MMCRLLNPGSQNILLILRYLGENCKILKLWLPFCIKVCTHDLSQILFPFSLELHHFKILVLFLINLIKSLTQHVRNDRRIVSLKYMQVTLNLNKWTYVFWWERDSLMLSSSCLFIVLLMKSISRQKRLLPLSRPFKNTLTDRILLLLRHRNSGLPWKRNPNRLT